nr:MAG TPA: hypothetical protein [Caudoviricetes sp.]
MSSVLPKKVAFTDFFFYNRVKTNTKVRRNDT